MKPQPSEAHNPAGIPQGMKSVRRWVAWKAVQKDGKWTKVPFAPNGQAKSNDPDTWVTYEEAAAVGRGVGFMLGDGYLGVDLDGVIVDGQLKDQWIRDWVASCATYVETSPSGTGLHAIFEGVALPQGSANRKGPVEVYDRARFFCITGKVPTPDRRPLGGSQTAVDALCRRFLMGEPSQAAPAPDAPAGQQRDASLDDWALCRDLARRGFTAEEIAEQLRAKMRADGRSEKEARPDYVAVTVRKCMLRFAPTPAAPLEILSLRDVLGRWPERPPYVVTNFIREGEVGALIAPPKSRKSWIAADLAICVAAGLSWFERFPCEQGRVLLVDNELQPGDLGARINAVCQGHGFSPLEVADRIDVLTLRESETPIDEVMAQLASSSYKLTIWDALYMMLLDDMDENSNSDMSKLLRIFRRFATKSRAATVFVHHTAKGKQDGKKSIDMGAGAGVIGRAPDAHMTLLEDEENEDRYAVRFSLRSSARPAPFVVEWNPRLWRYEQAIMDPLEIVEKPKRKKASSSTGG